MTERLRLTINGEDHELPCGSTVKDLLERFSVDLVHVAVERNRELVAKTEFATTVLEDRDQLEVVTLVGGG